MPTAPVLNLLSSPLLAILHVALPPNPVDFSVDNLGDSRCLQHANWL